MVQYMPMKMLERNLPPYLAHDLEAWKKGVEEKSRFLDCLWGELYGSINIAEINDAAITHEQAQYLREQVPLGEGRMTEAIDFTSCERLPGRAYNGANGKKIASRYTILFDQKGIK